MDPSAPSTMAASFTDIVDSLSLCRMPATSRSISSTGQYVMPSPYDKQRPQYTGASSPPANSLSRRLFPMPGGPSSVRSSGRCDERALSQRWRSMAISDSRPTIGAREISRRVRGVHGGDGMLDRERRSDRALGVILVRHRCTEDRHDGISDELLDGATVAFEHGPQLYVVRIEHAAHGFGIELFSLGGETDEIGKQDR